MFTTRQIPGIRLSWPDAVSLYQRADKGHLVQQPVEQGTNSLLWSCETRWVHSLSQWPV